MLGSFGCWQACIRGLQQGQYLLKAPCSVAATFSARSLILASTNAEDLWAMRGVCGFLVASPTEVPKPGYDYAALAGHLLQPDRPDLQGRIDQMNALVASFSN